MPQSKAEYKANGLLAAKVGRSRAVVGLKEGSWQHKAWLEGFDSAPKKKKGNGCMCEPSGSDGLTCPDPKTESPLCMPEGDRILQGAWDGIRQTKDVQLLAKVPLLLAGVLSVRGPLYPSRLKGRSKRGWTTPVW